MSFSDRVLHTTTRQLVYKGLDANGMRNRAIAQNLANVVTPGYQRIEVGFEEQLRKAMQLKLDGTRTDEGHLGVGRQAALQRVVPETYIPEDPTLPGEINNVDVDLEMSKMAENQIQYDFNIKFASFEKLIAAIRGQAY